MATVNKASKW